MRHGWTTLSCIEGEFVTVKTALRHSGLDRPVAFLDDWEMAPLLKQLDHGLTAVQVARSWSNRIPLLFTIVNRKTVRECPYLVCGF